MKKSFPVVLCTISLLLVSCSSGGQQGAQSSSASSAQKSSTEKVSSANRSSAAPMANASSDSSKRIVKLVTIYNNALLPKTVTIHAGTAVAWFNKDSVPHTIVSDDPTPAFPTKSIEPAARFNKVFKEAGTFKYHMDTSTVGTIVVQ